MHVPHFLFSPFGSILRFDLILTDFGFWFLKIDQALRRMGLSCHDREISSYILRN